MTEESIFSGFGGQGVLTMGKMLGYAGIIEDKEVAWMPSYGPEMRGGTANCIVIVSDKLISSPIIAKYDTVVALNQPSVDKFEDMVKVGGNMLYDSTTIVRPPTRSDINIFPIAASEEAVKMNNSKILNMIVLGAFIEARGTVKPESVYKALEQVLPERAHKLIPLNKEAFERGMALIKK